MRQFTTQGIILIRTNYDEAARIMTFLTPDRGKIRVIARGVRKSKSKLAGGLELFSVSDLSVLEGRSDINTLTSTRLVRHYGQIVKDLARTNMAYEFMRLLNRATEEKPEPAYFELLNKGLQALNDDSITPELTRLWFNTQLIKLTGHAPNLRTDISGNKLAVSKRYIFNLDKMCLSPNARGRFDANDIKFLRLGFAAAKPEILNKVKEANIIVPKLEPLIQSMLQAFIRL